MPLIYAILHSGLEHLRVWVSVEGPGTSPLWMLRDNLGFGGVKYYTQIFDCAGVSTPKAHVVQGLTNCP